jgi:hypothetical protein
MSLRALPWSEMLLSWDEWLAEISKAPYFEMILPTVEISRSE